MRKFLIFSLICVVIIGILLVVFFSVRKTSEKSLSPEEEVVFNEKDLSIKVFYNRPFKKGRVIFGELVPYNQVWRTGANEATTFETTKDLKFNDSVLKAGKYSLWTIPNQESWTIIFNKEYGQWGVNSEGQANRDAAQDALTIDAPALQQDQVIEQFTISFEDLGEDIEMVLFWDRTLISIPFTAQ